MIFLGVHSEETKERRRHFEWKGMGLGTAEEYAEGQGDAGILTLQHGLTL